MGFKLPCSTCNFVITKESLAVYKLSYDMSLDPDDKMDFETHEYGTFLPFVPLSVSHVGCWLTVLIPQRHVTYREGGSG